MPLSCKSCCHSLGRPVNSPVDELKPTWVRWTGSYGELISNRWEDLKTPDMKPNTPLPDFAPVVPLRDRRPEDWVVGVVLIVLVVKSVDGREGMDSLGSA